MIQEESHRNDWRGLRDCGESGPGTWTSRTVSGRGKGTPEENFGCDVENLVAYVVQTKGTKGTPGRVTPYV